MNTHKGIIKQKQQIRQYEKSLNLEKIKKSRAETRRKIEPGGLVIKACMDAFSKSQVLEALDCNKTY